MFDKGLSISLDYYNSELSFLFLIYELSYIFSYVSIGWLFYSLTF